MNKEIYVSSYGGPKKCTMTGRYYIKDGGSIMVEVICSELQNTKGFFGTKKVSVNYTEFYPDHQVITMLGKEYK